MYHTHHYPLPCLYCHPHNYIRMVQNLIERCLLFHMSQEQCIKALSEHAGIKPLVTLTVWKELQKENREFFRAYIHVITLRPLMSRYFQRRPRLARRKYRK
ncbi:putative angiotensin-converting enzyme 2 [Lupinus albus]|uniref:Putative angiotensin-converting enzyme 2 n=1 Tax=Lupinus albus TaxID=3870 RepID=A0A6A4PCH7_LUPAL|nr:putative angiotensin-converting enzyme 2 [Lupinus albus]